MPTGSSIQLVRLLGIRIGVSTSWFFVLFLFIWLLSDRFQSQLFGSPTRAYVLAVAAAVLFFASLILHELGHALAARQCGIKVTGIDLWFFGGVAKMSRDSRSPGEELWVAVAGPLVTAGIIALCVALGLALDGSRFVDAAILEPAPTASAALVLLAFLASINVALLVFNLIPAFPLDGGRIARAAAWKLTGEKTKATRFAGRTGLGFAYLLGGFGLFVMLRGAVFDGLWLAILALFLGQAARGAVAQSDLDERLEGVTVSDVMDPDPLTIDADTPLIEASDRVFAGQGWPWVAITERDGRYAGVLHRADAERVLAEGRPTLPVREVVDQPDGRFAIDLDEPLEALLGADGLRQLGAVFAVDHDGILRGVVTVDRVRRALTPKWG
ncbi:MAG TPA: site-2 protease family protein [Capillimicrobium sp.]|nr:site-2 protease family protein [Capillimicrobium sp.]